MESSSASGELSLLLLIVPSLLALAAIVVAAWAVLRLHRLERGYHLLLSSAEGGSLEEMLSSQLEQMREAAFEARSVEEAVRSLQENSRIYLQRMGLVRYNPFRSTGGDQSFVIAMADADGNGAVISSLHNRDATRIYAKPLTTWQSAYPLTEEEDQAISQARRFGKPIAS